MAWRSWIEALVKLREAELRRAHATEVRAAAPARYTTVTGAGAISPSDAAAQSRGMRWCDRAPPAAACADVTARPPSIPTGPPVNPNARVSRARR